MKFTSFCGRKVKYATYDAADRSMKNLVRHKRETNLHVYQCPECQKYHVGHEHTYQISKNEQRRSIQRYKRIKGVKHEVPSYIKKAL